MPLTLNTLTTSSPKLRKKTNDLKIILQAEKQIQDDFSLPQNEIERFFEFNITNKAGARENMETLNFNFNF